MGSFSVEFKITTVVILYSLLPFIALAQQEDSKVCSAKGYTIETVNGVFTDKAGAISNRDALKYYFEETYNGEKLTIDYLLNPSHKVLDLTDVAIQKTFEDVNRYDSDFLKILTDASSQVKTQKVLLVAHSQGNFYANNIYKTVTFDGDVPLKSIGVYSVATPASNVAGEGRHLTSSTDTIIARLSAYFLPGSIAPINDSINYRWSDDFGLGHDFSNIYLHYRPLKIVEDIKWSLDRLASNPARSENVLCIHPPKSLSFYERITRAVVYQVDLTLATGVVALTTTKNTISALVDAQEYIGTGMGNGFVAFSTFAGNAVQSVGTALGEAVVSFGKFTINSVKKGWSSGLALLNGMSAPNEMAAHSVSTPDSNIETTPVIAPPAPAIEVEPPILTVIPAEEPRVQAIPDVAISIEQVVIETATTTEEVFPLAIETATTTPVVVTPSSPLYRGGGWVSGISSDAFVAARDEAAKQETASTTEETATSTDETATSTDDTVPTDTTTDDDVYDPNPVVVNEIAWMGTRAQANDEWIELYNRTGKEVDLTGWSLESRNSVLRIVLGNTIPAHGYFLLERTNASTTDQIQSMIYTGALTNSGPETNLYLKNGTTTVDAVDFGYWLAGGNAGVAARRTMERVSPYADGDNVNNWLTYSETLTVPFAKDAGNNDILGTPGAQNSVTGRYIPAPPSITKDTLWRAGYGPYYISAITSVALEATLTIEPGVVVKFTKRDRFGGGLIVNGVLRAEGVQDSPIVFTSSEDDAVDGIDTEGDGVTQPLPGDWKGVTFLHPIVPSVLDYVQMRYGGQGTNYHPSGWFPTYTGMVIAQSSSPEINNSVFASSTAAGLYIVGESRPRVVQSRFSDIMAPLGAEAHVGGVGIRLADASSTAEIIGNVFQGNTVGITSHSASNESLVVRDNAFRRNQRNAEFYSNTGWLNLDNSGNHDLDAKGGLHIGFRVGEGASVSLKADAMPYILAGGEFFTVDAGGTLTIEPGAVLKNNHEVHEVRGVLNARGTADNPIVFTSITDDFDGYDSDYLGDFPDTFDAWENIHFIGASSSESVLEYVQVRYGGKGRGVCGGGFCIRYYGATHITDASPTISHSVFDNNSAVAVFIEGDSQPVIRDTEIKNTFTFTEMPSRVIGGYGISIGSESSPILENNIYSGNVQDIVYR